MATLKAPVELFAGTVTDAGTVAIEVLLLVNVTVAPPEGVKALKDKVAEVVVVPVCTVAGLNVIDVSSEEPAGGAGVRVTAADRLTEAYVAVTVAAVVVVTALVVADVVALLAPAAIPTEDGTTTEVLLLESATTAPPVGAAAVSATVMPTLPPP
jgi:hypothetical protein